MEGRGERERLSERDCPVWVSERFPVVVPLSTSPSQKNERAAYVRVCMFVVVVGVKGHNRAAWSHLCHVYLTSIRL